MYLRKMNRLAFNHACATRNIQTISIVCWSINCNSYMSLFPKEGIKPFYMSNCRCNLCTNQPMCIGFMEITFGGAGFLNYKKEEAFLYVILLVVDFFLWKWRSFMLLETKCLLRVACVRKMWLWCVKSITTRGKSVSVSNLLSTTRHEDEQISKSSIC